MQILINNFITIINNLNQRLSVHKQNFGAGTASHSIFDILWNKTVFRNNEQIITGFESKIAMH